MLNKNFKLTISNYKHQIIVLKRHIKNTNKERVKKQINIKLRKKKLPGKKHSFNSRRKYIKYKINLNQL